MPRLKRTITIAMVGFFVATSGIIATEVAQPPAPAAAADLSLFDAGNIMSDAKFFDGNALSDTEVQSFLNAKVPTCTIDNGQPSHAAGAPYYNSSGAQYSTVASTCLKDYSQATPNMVGEAGKCSPYTGRGSESAASIIARIGQACSVSQKVLLVLLEKEQSLVRDTWPLVKQYDSATGFACYDNGLPCVSGYAGFFYQVWAAALQLQRYGTGSFTWYPVGQVSNILYQANNPDCGTKAVFISNRATAALYYYTPYTPNAAALAAGYGLGDACSAYGNRNFYQLYVDWFGSTQGNPDPKTMAATPVPTLSQKGAVVPGTLVTAGVAGWDAGVTFTYQWLRNGTAIASATGTSYTPGIADNGASLKVSVTGSKSGYISSTQTSTDSVQVMASPADIATAALRFHALPPARVADTRTVGNTVDGQAARTGAIGPSQVLRIPILGRGGVPSTGVDSVSLNVTVAGSTTEGHLTVFPSGVAVPNASNINFTAGQVVPNAVFVKLGADGSISVFNGGNSTNVVVDINGWYPTGGSFTTFAPSRILDTRSGMRTADGQYQAIGKIGSGQTLRIPIAGRVGVPAYGVNSVSLNVTVIAPAAEGHMIVYPSGSPRPNASNINFVAGEVVANAAITQVGPDGFVSVYNAGGDANLVIDINGWYSTADGFRSLTPARILDTRPGLATIDSLYAGVGAIGTGSTLRVPVLGRAGVPVSGVGAVSLNVTAVAPSAEGHIIVFPSGIGVPNSSNLNFTPGEVVANAVISKVGADGYITIFNATGSTNVVVDVNGWFPIPY